MENILLIFTMFILGERKIDKSKGSNRQIEIHPVHREPADFQSIYGQVTCSEVNPLIDFSTTSLLGFCCLIYSRQQ